MSHNPPKIIWQAQKGGQRLALACPIFEMLIEGDRGGGKTDTPLFKYTQHVNKGFGSHWRGLIFRREYKDLGDVINKSKRWFPRIFPEAKFYESASALKWVWPAGEELLFRHIKRKQDYQGYHGQEFPFIAWEELTTWPDDSLYMDMQSCARSSKKGVPSTIISTTNSYGVGHGWVKRRFEPGSNKIITDKHGNKRVSIKLLRKENLALLEADPDYEKRLLTITENDANKRKSWVGNSWDITAGGMIDDLWSDKIHKIKPFQIPPSWKIDRSFDWGSSAPYSVGWWAEADETPTIINGQVRHFPRGTLFRIYETYGWNGVPNQGTKEVDFDIADRVREIDQERFHNNVEAGPADASIFDQVNGHCIAWNMADKGVDWIPSNKSAGSRKLGAALIRQLLVNTSNQDREYPHFYVFDHCEQFLRTVPSIPRDQVDMDDVDTKSEDHIWDEVRYRVLDSGVIVGASEVQLQGI